MIIFVTLLTTFKASGILEATGAVAKNFSRQKPNHH